MASTPIRNSTPWSPRPTRPVTRILRAQLLQQAEQVLLDDTAIAPVYFGVTRDPRLATGEGLISNNININRTRFLSLDRTITSV